MGFREQARASFEGFTLMIEHRESGSADQTHLILKEVTPDVSYEGEEARDHSSLFFPANAAASELPTTSTEPMPESKVGVSPKRSIPQAKANTIWR